jgi:hypothetical protein
MEAKSFRSTSEQHQSNLGNAARQLSDSHIPSSNYFRSTSEQHQANLGNGAREFLDSHMLSPN